MWSPDVAITLCNVTFHYSMQQLLFDEMVLLSKVCYANLGTRHKYKVQWGMTLDLQVFCHIRQNIVSIYRIL